MKDGDNAAMKKINSLKSKKNFNIEWTCRRQNGETYAAWKKVQDQVKEAAKGKEDWKKETFFRLSEDKQKEINNYNFEKSVRNEEIKIRNAMSDKEKETENMSFEQLQGELHLYNIWKIYNIWKFFPKYVES